MPTIDEKLNIINKIMLDDAARVGDTIRKQLHLGSEQKLADIKNSSDLEAEREYNRETLHADTEKDSLISRVHIASRKMLMGARNDILESVLADLSERLEAFILTDDYYAFLLQNINDALAAEGMCEKAMATEIMRIIYLTPLDFSRYGGRLQELYPGADVRSGEADMIGGVKTEDAQAGVFVDNSIKKKIEMCMDELFQISELTIGR